MRGALIILLLISTLVARGTNYYVKTGGSDAAAGTSDATAWATITRVNTAWSAGVFAPGDSILFQRGNTWYGTITIAEAGTSGSPIVIGAYGVGAEPIIEGFMTLSSWTSVGDTIYYATLTGESATEMVAIDGVQYAKGRWPNSTWMTVASRPSSTRVIGAGQTGTPDWTGAELVIRENRWTMTRHPITDHSNDTITFSTALLYNPTGYGYFIQNDLSALDRFGEWYHDHAANRLYVHMGDSIVGDYVIRASALDYGVDVDAYENIVVTGINLRGFNKAAIYANYGDYDPHGLKIDDCVISHSGGDAIYINRSSADTISNNTISYSNHCAVTLWGNFGENCLISGNTISYSGTVHGAAFNSYGATLANNAYDAIYTNPNYTTVTDNRVTYTGYIPINYRGTNALVQNNFISHYAYVKDDAAGIYVYDDESTGKRVLDNIILHGIGVDGEGMSATSSISAHGIYTDGEASNVFFNGNIVGYMATSGYHGNIPRNITITNNLFFQCRQFLNLWKYTSDEGYITGLNIRRNKFISTEINPNLPSMFYYNNSSSAYYTDLATEIAYFGSIDDNYYYTDNNIENHAYILVTPESEIGIAPYSLSRWTTEFGHDANSTLVDTLQLYTINNLGSNLLTNGTFGTNVAGWTGSADAPISWDNTNALGDGGSLLLETQVAPRMYYWWTNTYDFYQTLSVGIDNDKHYIFRGEVKSDLNGKTIAFKTRNTGTGYEVQRFMTVSSTATTKEILLSSPTTVASPANFKFASCDDTTSVWFDNLELYEADVTTLDAEDYLHLIYNDSDEYRVYGLSASMGDVDGAVYDNTVVLPPWTGKVLVGEGTVTIIGQAHITAGGKYAVVGGKLVIIGQ